MTYFFRLCWHEIKSLFLSGTTYVAGVLFLGLMMVLYWMLLQDYGEYEQSQSLVTAFTKLFWLPALYTIPLLTMRSIAEEKRLGTLELILTSPIRPLSWVLTKFVAAYTLYLFFWLLTLLFPVLTVLSLKDAGASSQLLQWEAISGSYLFIGLSSFLYMAVGIFSSSLTRSQLVAGILCFSILFICVLGSKLLETNALVFGEISPTLAILIDYLQTFEHLHDFSLGILDTRPFVFYIVNGVLLLWTSALILEQRV